MTQGQINTLNDIYAFALRMPFTPQHIAPNLSEIESQIKRTFPGGVHAVVFRKSSIPGWAEVRNTKGIIAILIGLIGPSTSQPMRDVATGQASGIMGPKPYVRPGGAVGYYHEEEVLPARINWT